MRPQPITITAPDLQVDFIVLHPSSIFGNSINLSWTVRNAGDATATSGWRDRLYLSRDNTIKLLINLPLLLYVPLLLYFTLLELHVEFAN